jgi:hypothetical protein
VIGDLGVYEEEWGFPDLGVCDSASCEGMGICRFGGLPVCPTLPSADLHQCVLLSAKRRRDSRE